MEQILRISNINDFIFCPASIYYHNMYENLEKITYQDIPQLEGTYAHKSIDTQKYSSKKSILQGMDIYSEKYKLVGKIDTFDVNTKEIVERKNKVITIYDGYVFQLYAQYFCLIEIGYEVKKISIYSMKDNKKYKISLPEEDKNMFLKFESVLNEIRNFNLEKFRQSNIVKCKNCIYAPLCVNGGEML